MKTSGLEISIATVRMMHVIHDVVGTILWIHTYIQFRDILHICISSPTFLFRKAKINWIGGFSNELCCLIAKNNTFLLEITSSNSLSIFIGKFGFDTHR
jgi:hypothetical protein